MPEMLRKEQKRYKMLSQEEAMTSPQITVYSGRVREPGVLAATSLKFNLEEEIRRLRAEPRWQAGHTAKTIAKYADFRVVLIVMKAGAQLVRHRTAGRISICLLYTSPSPRDMRRSRMPSSA